jgi:hypothetical protein
MNTAVVPVRRRCKVILANGEQCKNAPIKGGVVCFQAHGGRSGQVQLAAKRRLVESDARKALVGTEHEPLADPVTALLTVASEYMALKDELGRRASELESIAVTDRTGAQNVAATLQAYMHSLDAVTDTLVKINRLGLEARRDAAAAATLDRIVEATRMAVWRVDIDLSEHQALAVLDAIGQEFDKLRVA